MIILFAHDHRFIVYNGENYSNGFTNEIFQRYLDVFQNLNVVARYKCVSEYPNNINKLNNSIKLNKVPDFKSLRGLVNYFEVCNIVEKAVIESDIIIARSSSIAHIAIKYAKKHKKPYIYEIVYCPWDSLWNYGLKGKIVAPFAFLKQKKIASEAKNVIYVTKEFLQSRYPTQGESISCSNVKLDEVSQDVLKQRIQFINGKNLSGKIIIGTTAAVNVKFKGQESVIRALSKLKKDGITNFEYQLVGGGNQQYLKSIAKKHGVADQIVFLGSKPHEEVISWLRNIDIYIQPSKQEGLPRALIEAMGQGLYCIGTNVAGIPELLDSKCIVSKGRKTYLDIYQKLKDINKDLLIEQALENSVKAEEYLDSKLAMKRRVFFEDVKREFLNL